mmetsp:Transcript_7462/g.16050  ORF Transcript_7462/g.16050 Transcript_7462/m.16050 type:complete len:252 (+) Transcript_7462:2255-3010(+)
MGVGVLYPAATSRDFHTGPTGSSPHKKGLSSLEGGGVAGAAAVLSVAASLSFCSISLVLVFSVVIFVVVWTVPSNGRRSFRASPYVISLLLLLLLFDAASSLPLFLIVLILLYRSSPSRSHLGGLGPRDATRTPALRFSYQFLFPPPPVLNFDEDEDEDEPPVRRFLLRLLLGFCCCCLGIENAATPGIVSIPSGTNTIDINIDSCSSKHAAAAHTTNIPYRIVVVIVLVIPDFLRRGTNRRLFILQHGSI